MTHNEAVALMCHCGCGQKAKRHPKGGYCLYIRGHKAIESRFWEKVIKSENADGCWIWTASKSKAGYGRVNIKAYPSQIASRTAWIFTYGSIPEGLDVLHKCDNPMCVNPNHLFLGTQLDNVRDMYAKGRQASNTGEKNPRSKLTWNDVRYIRERYAQHGISYVKLGKQMGVDAAQIYRIINNITWKENEGNKG